MLLLQASLFLRCPLPHSCFPFEHIHIRKNLFPPSISPPSWLPQLLPRSLIKNFNFLFANSPLAISTALNSNSVELASILSSPFKSFLTCIPLVIRSYNLLPTPRPVLLSFQTIRVVNLRGYCLHFSFISTRLIYLSLLVYKSTALFVPKIVIQNR